MKVSVNVCPPRSPLVRAGHHEFEVTCSSEGVDSLSEVVALSADVEPFIEITATMDPSRSAGVDGGDHGIRLINAGNSTADLPLAGLDPQGVLNFTFQPQSLGLEPGEEASTSLRSFLAHR
jgi:hypothetical protein